jgi:hypothetical protein
MKTGTGSAAAGQQSALPAVGGGAAKPPPQRLRQGPPEPAQMLVPNGKTGSWDGYRTTGVGAWEWYMASGLLCLDQTSMALLGVDPGLLARRQHSLGAGPRPG